MLSDEEKKAIERAEFLIKIDTYLEKEMLTNLLNLIKKQYKEIEELKELDLIKIKGKEYVSKDKIKAKIEYLLKRYDTEEDFCSYDVLISILKSLLEKE